MPLLKGTLCAIVCSAFTNILLARKMELTVNRMCSESGHFVDCVAHAQEGSCSPLCNHACSAPVKCSADNGPCGWHTLWLIVTWSATGGICEGSEWHKEGNTDLDLLIWMWMDILKSAKGNGTARVIQIETVRSGSFVVSEIVFIIAKSKLICNLISINKSGLQIDLKLTEDF